jgi:tetraacyldisaccharide 4'-kinase
MLSPTTFRAIISGQRRDPMAVLLRWGLSVGEWPYCLATAVRNRRYDRGRAEVCRVGVPVVSVGNLTAGGTGKTPLVAWLARWFRQQGVRVSLISRGYGAQYGSRNDEARELEWRLPDVPHLQHPDRVAAAEIAIAELETQLIILDDAFQHRRIARDLDIVLIDATEPFGYDHLLPRGLLRESVRGLHRADAIVLSRCDLVSAARRTELQQHVRRWAPAATWVEMVQQPAGWLTASGQRRPVDDLKSARVLAFCGIGNPEAFRQTLARLGCQLSDFRAFPDHHAYDAASVQQLVDWATHSDATAIVCTHKDLVKLTCDRLGPLPLYALLLDAQPVVGVELLEAKLLELTRRVATS